MHIFLIILIIVGSISFAHGTSGEEIKDVSLSIGFSCLFVACLIIVNSWRLDYKQGQIDALNGKVRYKLQTNTDKTPEWIEIQEHKI